MLKILLLLTSIFILVGCCPVVPKPPVFDTYLLSLCTNTVVDKKFTSWEDVLTQKAVDKKTMLECMGKHEGLVNSYYKYLKEFSGETK